MSERKFWGLDAFLAADVPRHSLSISGCILDTTLVAGEVPDTDLVTAELLRHIFFNFYSLVMAGFWTRTSFGPRSDCLIYSGRSAPISGLQLLRLRICKPSL